MVYLFWYNVSQQTLQVGQKGDDHKKTNDVLEGFQWSRVFRFQEHLDLWIDVKCGYLVRRYLKDINKLLYFAKFHFNY